MTESKECSRCGVARPLTDFNRQKGRPDGRRAACRPCQAVQWQAFRPKRQPRSDAAYRQTARGREVHRQKSLNRRARRKAAGLVGYPVTSEGLSGRFRASKGQCYLCGLPVDPAAFHWDHVKPLDAGGLHILANLRPTHPVCNLRKGAHWPL